MIKELIEKVEQIYSKEIKKSPNKVQEETYKLDDLLGKLENQQQSPLGLRQLIQSLSQTKVSNELLGRESQQELIQSFISRQLYSKRIQRDKREGESNYKKLLLIEGTTGVGKTLFIRNFLKRKKQNLCYNEESAKFIYINAKKLRYPQLIYTRIINQLADFDIGFGIKSPMRQLTRYFEGKSVTGISIRPSSQKVLVIDQVDSLQLLTEQILDNILIKWPKMKTSNLQVIFIYSQLELEKRFGDKVIYMPERVHLFFEPYTAEQLQRIVKQKLELFPHAFQKQALQLFCELFAQRQNQFKKCLIMLKEIACRHVSKSQFDFDQNNPTVENIPVTVVQQTFNQISWNNSFSDDFCQFPKPYKIVIYCITEYFYSLSPHSYPLISYNILCQASRKILRRGQTELLNILYDLHQLQILNIQYKPEKEKQIDRKQIIKTNPSAKIQNQIIQFKLTIQQVLDAKQKDSSFRQLLPFDFQYSQAEKQFHSK